VYFDRRYQIAVYAISLSVTAVLFALMLLQGFYIPSEPYFVPISQKLNNAIALGLILTLTPPAILEFNNSRWLHGVDVNIPRLLRDVTESVSSGVSLINALEEASTHDYGPVSKPLESAMVKFNLTSDIEEALTWLGDRLIRPVAKRFSTILIEAYETGGKITEVLNTSVDLFTNLAEYREEKDAQMRPYTSIVYLSSFVFLVISWVILVQFLSPLVLSSADPLVAQSGLLKNVLDINYYKSILFWAGSMEALLGGLVAGKIRGGRIAAGLIHSVLLLVITVVFFNAFSV
jgi:flagellar protein FlaJ